MLGSKAPPRKIKKKDKTMTIVFDFDGTLHDTSHLFGCAVREVLKGIEAEGYRIPEDTSDEKVSTYLGFSAYDTWNDYAPWLPEDVKKEMVTRVAVEMEAQIELGNVRLYPGIPEVLDALKKNGVRLAILSNCLNGYLEAHDRYFDLKKWFDGFYPGQKYDYIPKRDIMKIIMKDLPDDSYVMIGDRASDIDVGELENVRTIGCTYGFGTAEELKTADFIAETPLDILKYVL